MDPMLGFDIRLVFTLPPRDSRLQSKRCVHEMTFLGCHKDDNKWLRFQDDVYSIVTAKLLMVCINIDDPSKRYNNSMD